MRMPMTESEELLEEFLKKKALTSQLEAIKAHEHLVVVSAGAGTGKTWTLAWRFIWALATGRSKAKEILTLTFTDKAALEMESRIKSLMEETLSELPEAKGLLQVRDNLKKGLLDLDDAYISTIHSFARRVIQESGLSLEGDPGSSVISSPETDLFWNRMEEALDCLDKTWAKGHEEILESQVTREILSLYGPSQVASFAKGLIDLSSGRGDRPKDLLVWAEEIKTRHEKALIKVLDSLKPLWDRTFEVWHGEGGILDEVCLSESTDLGKKLSNIKKLKDVHEKDKGRFINDLDSALKGARGKLAKEIGALLPQGSIAAFRETMAKQIPMADLAEKGFSQKELELTSGLLRITALCWDGWDRFKNLRSLTSFDDMLVMAKDSLTKNPSYSLRFKEILVDEFQDVSGIQDNLIKALMVEGEPKRLFLVGDMKQSIYAFRHADPSLFGEYIKKSKAEGKYVALDVSFRTRDSLLQKTSQVFGKLWEKGLGEGLAIPYEALKSPLTKPWHERRQDISSPDFQVLITEELEVPESSEAKRERAAKAIALKLLSMVGNYRIWDKAAESQRVMEWKDASVLVRTRTFFPALKRVLSGQFGIPVVLEKNTSYYQRTEVQDAVCLLRFLADPKDQLALAGFLSSQLSPLSLKEAQDLMASSQGDLTDSLEKACPSVLRSLKRLRDTGRTKGASAALEEVLSNSEILKNYSPWRRRETALNLTRAMDLLREYESSLGKALIGPSGWIGQAFAKRAKEEEASVPTDDNCLKIMTIHGAKGLEFPVVILAEERGKPRGVQGSLTPSLSLGAVLSEGKDGFFSSKVHKFLEERAKKEEDERLFYVAFTRARDCLVEAAFENSPWLSIMGDSGLFKELPSQNDLQVPVMEKPFTQIETAQGEIPPKASKTLYISNFSGSLDRISPTSWALYRHCPKAWRMKFRQGLNLSWGYGKDEGSGSADLGSMVHWVLERWDFTEKSLLNILNQGALRAPSDMRKTFEGPSKDQVMTWLKGLLETEEGKRLRFLNEKGRLKREAPFRIPLENGLMLVGSADVMWEENGCFFIRDYKTTALKEFPKIYSDQVRLYGLAAEKAFSPKSLDMGLLPIRDGFEVQAVSLFPYGSWKDLEKQVMEDGLKASKGPWDENLQECPECPFRAWCLSP